MSENTRRINVTLPTTLLDELDSLVPAGKRSEVIAEATATYLSRLKVLAAIRETQGAWEEKDHPELATPDDVSAWLQALRSPWRRVPLLVRDRDDNG
jgi:Arc/MetJ-type ribon-helix-helix transcriptional regulator